MRIPAASFFQRLRRHRGAWMLVALAMLIKFAASTACLLDGPIAGPLAGESSAVTVSGTPVADVTMSFDDEHCVLGEAGGCHCACAHAVTLPAYALSISASAWLPGIDSHPPVAPLLGASVSPLRPPIA
jgi:hypothetical protein